jgi:hypothetical protein
MYGPPGHTHRCRSGRKRSSPMRLAMGDAVLGIARTELAPEILLVDAAANLAAVSGLTLGAALLVALILAVRIACGDEASGRQRWLLVVAWGASTIVTAATAVPAGRWAVPLAAALALPLLTVVGRAVHRGVHEWVVGERSASQGGGTAIPDVATYSRRQT